MSTLLESRSASALPAARVDVLNGEELRANAHWCRAFADQRKDNRYYDLLEDTLPQGFEYRYFVIKDAKGDIKAVQPFFLLNQNILAGASRVDRAIAPLRRLWPRFMCLRTLMVGCTAGEAHVDSGGGAFNAMPLLAKNIRTLAKELGAHLIVLKEFPAQYRTRLRCFEREGFVRVPSMPMTWLDINFKNFDDYLTKKLSAGTRRNLRRKLKATEEVAPIEMTLTRDVTSVIDEVYPLYLQVFQRSKLQFEKLTPEFFCRLGQTMPDKVQFFLWRQNGRLVAFALCMVQGDEIFGEYLGLDYETALDLHLYHYVTRDIINWAISNGFKTLRSSGLNYDPKLHMRHVLDPLDLYVRHTNPALNRVLKLILPLIEPTRHDLTLRKFPNYNDLWGQTAAGTFGDGDTGARVTEPRQPPSS